MFHLDWLIFHDLCVYLYAAVSAQLLCIQSRAVDGVEGQFSSSREERGGFGEELLILCFHGNCFDEHGVTRVFVRFQLCLETIIRVFIKNL